MQKILLPTTCRKSETAFSATFHTVHGPMDFCQREDSIEVRLNRTLVSDPTEDRYEFSARLRRAQAALAHQATIQSLMDRREPIGTDEEPQPE